MRTTKQDRQRLRENVDRGFGVGDYAAGMMLDDLDTLEQELEWYKSGGVHTCHEKCQRLPCKQARALEKAKAFVEKMAWLDNPNDPRDVCSPRGEIMAEARQALADIEGVLNG